jgi:hypothetical protein
VKPTVFIQTNDKQYIGALVAAHALVRNSLHAGEFDVRLIRQEDYPFFAAREGQLFLRGGQLRPWRNDDLQSFTPTRFMPPELMGYRGRAVVIDPDVFAVGDVWELLARDMGDKAIFAVPRPGHNGRADYLASSVMLLDCARLRHWRVEQDFAALFARERDYVDWVELALEPRATIGLLEKEWNDFDHLDERTRLLHTTKRRTQPWKTGLPIDFTVRDAGIAAPLRQLLRRVTGQGQRYRRHPDPRQEQLFVDLLRECVQDGTISRDMLRDAMARNHVRHDILALVGTA